MSDFDFDDLRAKVVAACKEIFSETAAQLDEDDLCAFAVFTDSGAMTVCPAMCRASHVDQCESLEDRLFYKYSPTEWVLEGSQTVDGPFNGICSSLYDHVERMDVDSEAFRSFRVRLIETCVEAQLRLRRDFFHARGEDFLLLVTISNDEEPVAELRERIQRLNSASISDEYHRWTKTWSSA